MAMTYEYDKGEEDGAVSYTYSDALDVSGATLTLTFKRDMDDSTAAFIISNDDFDVTDAATGVILWPFTSTHLATAETYYGELKAVLDADNTDKRMVSLRVKEAVT